MTSTHGLRLSGPFARFRTGSVAALLVLFACACTVEDLPLDGLACDDAHPCAAGYTCSAGSCLKGGAAADAGALADGGGGDGGAQRCTKGATRPCGSAIGECRQGTETCGEDGVFGACAGGTAATSELCDGKDNNCDGVADEGLDDDHDGYGPGATTCPKGKGDCDDHDAAVHPGAVEICDKKDNDCDGNTDNAPVTAPCELTKGVCSGARHACVAGVQETVCSAATYGASYQAGAETSCDGKDNNCDGKIDEALDDDNDGYGVVGTSCAMGATFDCDDKDAAVHPGAVEICDGKDNDCDRIADDGTGFICVKGTSKSCTATAGGCTYSGTQDCDATCLAYVACKPPVEICNGIDDNCDGTVDEGLNLGFTVLTQGTGDARDPAIAALPSGGFAVAYGQATKTSPTQTAIRLQTVLPDSSLGALTTVSQTSDELGTPALSPRHVIWRVIDPIPIVAKTSVMAATWTATPALSTGTPFEVLASGTDTAQNLVAFGLAGAPQGTTLAAWESVRGAARELRLATLSGGSAGPVRSVSVSGSALSHPTVGPVGTLKQNVLFYSTLVNGQSAEKLAARALDPSGNLAGPELVFTLPGASVNEPAAAPDALAYTETTNCTACGSRRRINLVRTIAALKPVPGGGNCGAEVCLGKLAVGSGLSAGISDATQVDASSPSITRVAPDVYVVAWVETDSTSISRISTVRATWDQASGAWVVGTATGITAPNNNILSVKIASDGVRAGFTYDSLSSTASSDVRYRTTCPF